MKVIKENISNLKADINPAEDAVMVLDPTTAGAIDFSNRKEQEMQEIIDERTPEVEEDEEREEIMAKLNLDEGLSYAEPTIDEICDWLAYHEQAWEDAKEHFHCDPCEVAFDDLISWIYEHDQLAADFNDAFDLADDINEKLDEDVTARSHTDDLISAIEDGFLDWETVGFAALKYLSDDDVKELCDMNEWAIGTDFEEALNEDASDSANGADAEEETIIEEDVSDVAGSVGDIIKTNIFPKMDNVTSTNDLLELVKAEFAEIDPKFRKYADEVIRNLAKKPFAKACIYLGDIMLKGSGLGSPDMHESVVIKDTEGEHDVTDELWAALDRITNDKDKFGDQYGAKCCQEVAEWFDFKLDTDQERKLVQDYWKERGIEDDFFKPDEELIEEKSAWDKIQELLGEPIELDEATDVDKDEKLLARLYKGTPEQIKAAAEEMKASYHEDPDWPEHRYLNQKEIDEIAHKHGLRHTWEDDELDECKQKELTEAVKEISRDDLVHGYHISKYDDNTAQITKSRPYDDAEYYWAKLRDGAWYIIFKGKRVDTMAVDSEPDQVANKLAELNKDIDPRIITDSLTEARGEDISLYDRVMIELDKRMSYYSRGKAKRLLDKPNDERYDSEAGELFAAIDDDGIQVVAPDLTFAQEVADAYDLDTKDSEFVNHTVDENGNPIVERKPALTILLPEEFEEDLESLIGLQEAYSRHFH